MVSVQSEENDLSIASCSVVEMFPQADAMPPSQAQALRKVIDDDGVFFDSEMETFFDCQEMSKVKGGFMSL